MLARHSQEIKTSALTNSVPGVAPGLRATPFVVLLMFSSAHRSNVLFEPFMHWIAAATANQTLPMERKCKENDGTWKDLQNLVSVEHQASARV